MATHAGPHDTGANPADWSSRIDGIQFRTHKKRGNEITVSEMLGDGSSRQQLQELEIRPFENLCHDDRLVNVLGVADHLSHRRRLL